MESGIVDGEEVQVFRAKPAPPYLIEQAHTCAYGKHAVRSLQGERPYFCRQRDDGCRARQQDRQRQLSLYWNCGHHASRGGCWGFCYFNDVAITISRLRELGLERFLIVDVDPHFGDGTRDFFGNDADVFHINFHSGTGEQHDPAKNNYDIGLGFGASDEQFLSALQSAVDLAKDFDFQIAFVIFGHDSHQDDYGGFNLTFKAYPRMDKIIKEAVGDKGLVFVLSGGSCIHVAEKVIPGDRSSAGRWPL
jgi:acetoin utilization deacetylase AcuC-like enzyme